MAATRLVENPGLPSTLDGGDLAIPAARNRDVVRLPHPIPYQGSKRLLAARILALVPRKRFDRFVDPFAGSGAMTLAAAHHAVAGSFVMNDSLPPLIDLWRLIVAEPGDVANRYAAIWRDQDMADARYYNDIRAAFNRDRDPVKLLYLLARCVKNAPRFNQDGAFNQSPDRRRRGMHPDKMRAEILGASGLLANRVTLQNGDFADVLAGVGPGDLVYLDPPYYGSSHGADRRYHQGLSPARLIEALEDLNRRGIPLVLSYDGRTGAKTYGPPMPDHLHLTRFDLPAGRSSQATLNGHDHLTVEAVYLSPAALAPPVFSPDDPVEPGFRP